MSDSQPVIDDDMTRWYMEELQLQAYYVTLASERYGEAIRVVDAGEIVGIHQIFGAIQGMLSAAAAIAKLLSPQPRIQSTDDDETREAKEFAVARGRHLRAALGASGATFDPARTVRNAFEHFDERLDTRLRAGTATADMVISPKSAIEGPAWDWDYALRTLDPQTHVVSLAGKEVSLEQVVADAQAVGSGAGEWLTDHGFEPRFTTG